MVKQHKTIAHDKASNYTKPELFALMDYYRRTAEAGEQVVKQQSARIQDLVSEISHTNKVLRAEREHKAATLDHSIEHGP